jgi:hypothetical protein
VLLFVLLLLPRYKEFWMTTIDNGIPEAPAEHWWRQLPFNNPCRCSVHDITAAAC